MNKFINTMSVLILAFVVIILLLSSCSSTKIGCPDTWNKVGYR